MPNNRVLCLELLLLFLWILIGINIQYFMYLRRKWTRLPINHSEEDCISQFDLITKELDELVKPLHRNLGGKFY